MNREEYETKYFFRQISNVAEHKMYCSIKQQQQTNSGISIQNLTGSCFGAVTDRNTSPNDNINAS